MPREDEQLLAEQAAVQTYSERRRKGRINLGINGRSIPFDEKYRGMVYPVAFNASLMLGNPEAMLKEPTKGSKYVWKSRKRENTAALIRQGVLRPVGVDEVDKEHPYALFQVLTLAGKPVVAWESMILCEMPQKHADRRIRVWEDYAISQVTTAAEQWKQDVATVSHGAMVGEFTVSNPGDA